MGGVKVPKPPKPTKPTKQPKPTKPPKTNREENHGTNSVDQKRYQIKKNDPVAYAQNKERNKAEKRKRKEENKAIPINEIIPTQQRINRRRRLNIKKFNVLPIFILGHLSLCNGEWPLQSIGIESWNLKPVSQNPPGYPYEGVEWVESPQQAQLHAPDSQPKHDLKFPDETNLGDILNKDWVIGRVRSISEGQNQIRNDTDHFMRDLQDIYDSLGLDESDNNLNDIYKYGTSVILRFMLEFFKIFRRISSSSSQSNVPQSIDIYGMSYDEAVSTMKSKKNYTHLEIAVPVRRAGDIFKSIIYESVQIVQTKCSATGPNWECLILYLAELISESFNCSNIWYHALVHMLTLEAKPRQNNFVYNIVNFVKLTDIPFSNIYDYMMENILEYRELGRVQLRKEALLFSILADLQENGLLDCVYISELYN